MTREQKQLVRESFPDIREMAGPVALLFYGRLFALDPTLRPMFRQDIELQGRKLMDMLTAVVDNLDHFEGLAPTLRALGQKHAGYGVRPEHYETVAQALMWALGQALDTQFYPELRAAWLAIIEAVSRGMKNGAAELPAS
jgi:hemoglobin-like flavoprotein